MGLQSHETPRTSSGRLIEKQKGAYACWSSILRHVLSSLVAYDLLAECVDSTATVILHSGITLTPQDVELSLSSLDTHPLTILLEEQLSPVMDDEDYSAWSFLTSQIIEAYYDGAIPDKVSSTVIKPTVSPLATASESNLSSVAVDDMAESDPAQGMLAKNECELCERVMPLTIHHLIPRSTHPYFLAHQSLLSDTLLQAILGPESAVSSTSARRSASTTGLTKAHLLAHQARVCRPCHSQIHTLIPDHRELGREYSTIDRLVERDDIRKWVHYIRAQRGSDSRMGRGLRYRR